MPRFKSTHPHTVTKVQAARIREWRKYMCVRKREREREREERDRLLL